MVGGRTPLNRLVGPWRLGAGLRDFTEAKAERYLAVSTRTARQSRSGHACRVLRGRAFGRGFDSRRLHSTRALRALAHGKPFASARGECPERAKRVEGLPAASDLRASRMAYAPHSWQAIRLRASAPAFKSISNPLITSTDDAIVVGCGSSTSSAAPTTRYTSAKRTTSRPEALMAGDIGRLKRL